MPIGICAMGAYVPERQIGNDLMASWTGASEDWIESRTGIYARRYAPADMPTSELGKLAVRDLLARTPGVLTDLAGIVCTTSTPDQPQPPTAALVQHALGLHGVAAFDTNAVCAGLVVTLVSMAPFAAQHGQLLLVAADKYSAIVDPADPRTATLFGDGASALLLGAVPEGYGILAARMRTDGDLAALVQVQGGGSARPLSAMRLADGDDRFRMHGPEVARYVRETLPRVIADVLIDASLNIEDIDRLVCHQANPRLVRRLASDMGVPHERVPIIGDRYGNSGSGSVGVALVHSHDERPIARGEHVLLAAVGGGMTAAAALLRWY